MIAAFSVLGCIFSPPFVGPLSSLLLSSPLSSPSLPLVGSSSSVLPLSRPLGGWVEYSCNRDSERKGEVGKAEAG